MVRERRIIALLAITLVIIIGLAFLGYEAHKKKIAELEKIINLQGEKITQMKAQENVWQTIHNDQIAEDRGKTIAKGFLDTWEKVIGRDAPYRKVVVNDGVMKIYFSDSYEATAFISYAPEIIARFALDYFLRETGVKTGTVEYYTPLKKKIFSMSGTLSRDETKVYYKDGM